MSHATFSFLKEVNACNANRLWTATEKTSPRTELCKFARMLFDVAYHPLEIILCDHVAAFFLSDLSTVTT